jgi:hypothetical protein
MALRRDIFMEHIMSKYINYIICVVGNDFYHAARVQPYGFRPAALAAQISKSVL